MQKDDPKKIENYKSLINEYFQENNNYGKYSFKGMFKKQIHGIVDQFFNILVYYFGKYSEKEFHRRMDNRYILIDGKTGRHIECTGFDFIKDWKDFHKYKYAFFIKSVQAQKKWYVFSEDKIYDTIIKLFAEKGWNITDQEKLGIQQIVKRLFNILYLGYDGLDP
jgi:hypothetical protein